MFGTRKLFFTAFAALFMFASGALAQSTITITITAPTSGQAYAPNAAIDYAGNGNCDPKDSPLGSVRAQLVWTASDNSTPPPLGQGFIVDSDKAVLTCAAKPDGTRTGPYTYEYSINTITGQSNLLATQYSLNGNKQSRNYTVIAFPFTNHNDYYYSDLQGLNKVFTSRSLGSIY